MQAIKTKILFVCMGNICRSPTAQAVARRLFVERGLEAAVLLDSAGTHGYHIGAAPDRRSQQAGTARGFDLSAIRSRQVRPEDLNDFDLVLAMDDANYADLQALRARHGGRARIRRLLDFAGGGEVPDPYFGGGDGFNRVLDAVEAGCRGLVEAVAGGQLDPPGGPG